MGKGPEGSRPWHGRAGRIGQDRHAGPERGRGAMRRYVLLIGVLPLVGALGLPGSAGVKEKKGPGKSGMERLGKTKDGQEVKQFTLASDKLTVKIMTYGAT